MKAFQTDPDTGALIGEIVCNPSPLDAAQFLIPRGAVTTPPPAVEDGQIAVWSAVDEGWGVREDRRGTMAYDTATGTPVKVGAIGPLAEMMLTEVAPAPGQTWGGGGWVDPPLAYFWTALRRERDTRIATTDWTQLPDAPLSAAARAAWAAYRQALRDMPASTSDPVNPVWPSRPEE
ncbi:MAG: phage tail assembly chaperone [Rhodospirillum sp.]|nr:phage tail assembly chaperone [Rhodospirillum sp.]MCF8500169.1 phage tail assembly chaperone [Rhodospirillum sp.]